MMIIRVFQKVSILVLVDAALRHILCVVNAVFYYISFNPCFSGCRPATWSGAA